MPPFDAHAIRKDFPLFKKTMNDHPLIYFDSAATSQKPYSVIEAIHTFYAQEYGTVHRAIYPLSAHATEHYESVRKTVQMFINASRQEEVIFTKGTTEAINLVAHSFGRTFVKPGDSIIISEMEHHSNIIPWQLLCQERDITLKILPMQDTGELVLEALDQLLDETVKLVSLAHISNVTGTINPIKEITARAHEVGAKVMIDGAQAASHCPIDVQDLDVDFYAFSGHKMYGPTGVGVLYGKYEVLDAMPPFMGGGDMVESVSFESTQFQHPPLKFEAGTPAIASVIGLGAAIDYIQSIGHSALGSWHRQLLDHATHKLSTLEELRILGTSSVKSSIITFVIKHVHPLDLGTLLGLNGIAIRTGHLCAQPTLKHFGVEAAARVSFGIYNTIEEIDRFIHELKKVLVLCRPELSY